MDIMETQLITLERILTIRLAEAEKEIERLHLKIAHLEKFHEEDK